MRCMKVVLPEPAMPIQTTATGGLEAEAVGVEEDAMVMSFRPKPGVGVGSALEEGEGGFQAVFVVDGVHIASNHTLRMKGLRYRKLHVNVLSM